MYPPPGHGFGGFTYGFSLDCTWKLQPLNARTCNPMAVTVEFLDTERNRDILEIIDTSTNRVLGRLSGQSQNDATFPKQYVASSSEMTIRFTTDASKNKGKGFRISYGIGRT